MELRRILAKNLQRLRRAKGLSQEAFADHAQIDRTYISGLERAVRNPTLAVVERVAAALGVEPWELLRPRD